MKQFLMGITAVLVTTSVAFASTGSAEAFNNATVQPGGPRSGASGKAFLNVEGSDNGNFASYGVARFDLSAIKADFDSEFGAGNWQVDAVELLLTQANASFTNDGRVEVYWTGDDSTDIEPGTSPLAWPFSGDFADAEYILDYNFVEVASGHIETYDITGSASLIGDILSDSTVTLALVDGDAAVAATYAGYTNFDYEGPTLAVTASLIPEPASLALLGLGALLIRRR